MTQPGYIAPPSPGWWERTDRIGTTETDISVETSAAGARVPVDFVRPQRNVNGRTGPMVVRRMFKNRPGPQKARITPQFDAVGTEKHGTLTVNGTYTLAHTLGDSANCLIVVANIWTTSYINARLTATVGSQNFTLYNYTMNFNNDGTYGGCAYLLTLLNPPTGAQTISVTQTSGAGTCFVSSNSFSYSGVKSLGTVTKGNTAATTSPSLAITTATPGDLIFGFMSDFTQNYSSFNRTSRWTRNYTASTGESMIAGDGAATGASTTFSASVPVATVSCIMGLPLQAMT